MPQLQTALSMGRAYQQLAFFSETEVQTVLAELHQLELQGRMERKGLSNTSQRNQQFTQQDRYLGVVPWFVQALEGNDTRPIPQRIQRLHQTLAHALQRPTMLDTTLMHECYYSKSEVGSFLPRHMDERHEELKGAKGWISPSRRSLSWLIYLSDPAEWTLEGHGGALRTFPQQGKIEEGYSSTYNGDLQIGWLQPSLWDNIHYFGSIRISSRIPCRTVFK